MVPSLSTEVWANWWTWAACVTAALVAVYLYYDYQFKYFERRGLKNPRPWPIVGNLLASISKRRLMYERQWVQQCGKLYGIFQGSKPRFVIADAHLLRQICIKDFDVFPNHEAASFLNKYQRLILVFSQDEQWRRLRALSSPTFTSGKIKRMYKLLQRCAVDLADCFQEQLESDSQAGAKETIVHLKDLFGLYTMDGIASCGYGLKLERQRGAVSLETSATRNEFVSLALGIFKFRVWRLLTIFVLPDKLISWLGFHSTPDSVFIPLVRKVHAIIESRRRSGKHFDDYLQLLLDAKLDDKLELSELDTQENHHAGLTRESMLEEQRKMVSEVEAQVRVNQSKAQLSDDDILAGALSLLAVGVETTSTLLTHACYALAFHPEVQERLYETLRGLAKPEAGGEQEQFEYEALTSCAYLDSVISETLRMLSPIVQFDRICKRDYHVEKYNVVIPRGAKVLLAYYAIMHDPDYWSQPEQFDPERFMPANRGKIVPGSYSPFGLGPRHCLGMRFSLTEAKLGLATLLMRYKFERAPHMNFPPLSKRGFGLNSIETDQVIVKARLSA